MVDLLTEAYVNDRDVFIIGNGGSGANASHLCEDLGKGTLRRLRQRQKRLKVLSLTDNTPYILAWGNDAGFDRVFVEQLKNLAQPGRSAHRDQRLGQQPQHPERRRVGQLATA